MKRDPEPTFRMPRKLPMSVAAGILSGIVAGVAMGAVVGPSGAGLGLGLGLVFGFFAGKAIEKDERRSSNRTSELDAIIGITEGSLGAGPVSRVPTEHAIPEEGGRWLSEWLTPPPPGIAG